jgi:predicted secreted protein
MKRSYKCIFISHCLIAQAVMAKGLVKTSPAIVEPLLQFCLTNDVNIFQMPCPEILCESGGLKRDMRGKAWYEKNGLREICKDLAKKQVDYMSYLGYNGFNILAVIGVEFSPSCAPTFLNKGRMIVRDKGIFIEEIERELSTQNLKLPIIGVNQKWHKKLKSQLDSLLQ